MHHVACKRWFDNCAKEMKLELKETNDGSHTLFIPELNEHYHSHHGAIQEAMHVFIENGMIPLLDSKKELRILEVGWGTGLNCLLTLINSLDALIYYTGIEAFPIAYELYESLNYEKQLNMKIPGLYNRIVDAPWEKESWITSNFLLKKNNCDIQTWSSNEVFDLIYYDAFGPRAQEEMWHKDLLDKVIKHLKSNGSFVTYCAKGQLKRDLKSIGCIVETLPGPPGKREMTRAIRI